MRYDPIIDTLLATASVIERGGLVSEMPEDALDMLKLAADTLEELNDPTIYATDAARMKVAQRNWPKSS